LSQKMTVAAMHMNVCAQRSQRVDTAPVLEPAEHDLDLVALPLKGGIMRDRHLPVCL
jgi:hypothetical protein